MHPYTRGLLDSVPSRNLPGAPLAQIPGMTPSLANLPPGCAFRERCSRATETCLTDPPLYNLDGRRVRCFHPIHAVDEARA
jgi:peptide/nickel transport system ATP-binding protein